MIHPTSSPFPSSSTASSPLRVRHLIQPTQAGWSALHALSTLINADRDADRDASHFDHHVHMVGTSADERLLQRCAIPCEAHHPPSAFWTPAFTRARRSIGHRFSTKPNPDAAPYDVAHIWTPDALPVRQLLKTTHAPVVCAADIGGMPVDPALLDQRTRNTVRDAWDVSPNTKVLFVAGEPASHVCVKDASYVAGVLTVAGLPCDVVVPCDARETDRGKRYARHHNNAWQIIIDDRPPWEIIPACDIALWIDPACPTAANGLAWAAGCGLPVVAHDAPPARALLPDDSLAFFADSSKKLNLTRALYQALTDDSTRVHKQEAARAHINTTCDVDSWIARAHAAYTTTASTSMATREPAPTLQAPTETS